MVPVVASLSSDRSEEDRRGCPGAAVKRLPEAEILSRMRQAFLQHGYEKLSMVDLAQAVGLSRRALYYNYPNKEAVYRAMIRWGNDQAMAAGLQSGRAVRDSGGSPVDIFAEILNVRFGETRRMVENSPHSVELNAYAFMKCRDIAIEVAISFQRELADLIHSLVDQGVMRLRPNFSPADIAQTLAYGARGVNQALPPAPTETLAKRYRQMCEAVLFGAAVQTPRSPTRPRNRAGTGQADGRART